MTDARRQSESSIFAYGTWLSLARIAPVAVVVAMRIVLDGRSFGEFALFVTAVTTATLLSDAGLDSAATMRLSRESSLENRAEYHSALVAIRVGVAGVASGILILTLFVGPVSPGQVSILSGAVAVAGCMLVARNAAHRILLRIEGQGEPKSTLLEKTASSVVFILLVVVLPKSAEFAMLGFAVGTALGAIVARPATGLRLSAFSSSTLVGLVRAAAPFTVGAVAAALVWRTPVFVLGHLDGSESAGVFVIASYPVQLLATIPVLSAPLLLVHGRIESERHRPIIRRAALLGIGGALIVSAASVAYNVVLPDSRFGEAAGVASLLAWAIPFVWVNTVAAASLRSEGQTWAPTGLHLTCAIASVTALLPTISRFGVLGASSSVLGAEFLLALALWINLIRKAGSIK